MADPVSAVEGSVAVVKVARCACAPIARRIKYLWNLKDNLNILQGKYEELIAHESDIKRKVEKAKFKREKVSNVGNLLLQEVAKIKDKVSSIISSLEENKGCFFSYCRINLAKDVIEVTQEVDKILNKTSQFANELVVEQSPPRALVFGAAPKLVGNFMVEKNKSEILKSLRDPKIHKIGIYAMGGSGKTTTMMNINNQLAATKDFNKIIWVTVSEDFNLEKVQNDIAGQLNLKFSTNASPEQRSSELSLALKKGKKFLIILDDVWVWIPLDKVGIPKPDQKNGWKMVLTTRSSAICREMGTDKDIELKLLSKDEALELFMDDQVLPPKVHTIAEEIVLQCGGLPLGIITVSRAMRGELDIRRWEGALEDLRSSPEEIRGMEDDVFRLLHFSYSRLRKDELRKCFLYLALFPEDETIPSERLIRSWVDEGLIKGKGDFKKEMDDGFKSLEELVDVCMFERFEKTDEDSAFPECVGVRMHDLLRDLAIKIMREEGGVVARSALGVIQSPNEEEWNSASKISLTMSKITELPHKPDCPNLLTLLLYKSSHLEKISSSFFDQMPILQVLDLSFTSVCNLPPSISNLENLHALILEGCKNLREIPSLAKLKKVRTLNFHSTAIEALPEGMEEMNNLRSLNLSATRYLRTCLIPESSPLEEFCMLQSRFVEVEQDPASVAKFVESIACLKHLAILALGLVKYEDYLSALKHIEWRKLKLFRIQVSSKNERSHRLGDPFAKTASIYGTEVHSVFLPPGTEYVFMSKSKVPRLSGFSSNLNSLIKCDIWRCDSEDDYNLFLGDELKETAFTSLEHLTVRIGDLRVLWAGVIPPGCFANLRVLEVLHCISLNHLSGISLIQNLKNIEVIKVIDAMSMGQIVADSNEEGEDDAITDTIVLPRLHTLILENLPLLRTISSEPWVCVSLRHVTIRGCPSLKKLPFSIDTLSKLEKLKVDQSWRTLEWDDVDTEALADLTSKLLG